jgi:prepilin-type N-terminal cleavage/methylation domain-containing protein
MGKPKLAYTKLATAGSTSAGMRRAKCSKGSTLIETMVAMTVFAAAASATFNMLMMAICITRANALDSHAVALATQEREDLRSLQYPVITTRDPYTTASPDRFPAPNGIPFTVHSEVQNNAPSTNMKTVTITTSWSYLGRPRNYQIQTVYTNLNG